MPSRVSPTFTTAAFTFDEVYAASRRLTGADLLHILAGFAAAAILLVELRPILRGIAWAARIVA